MLDNFYINNSTVVLLLVLFITLIASGLLICQHIKREEKNNKEVREVLEDQQVILENQSEMLANYKSLLLQTEKLSQISQKSKKRLEDRVSTDTLSDAELFALIDSRMQEEELFLRKDIDIKQVSHIFNISQVRIKALFKAMPQYGNFSEYLSSKRLLYAVKLLTDKPFLNIKAVSDDSAFSSLTTFQRSFKQKMGMTASQYRCISIAGNEQTPNIESQDDVDNA